MTESSGAKAFTLDRRGQEWVVDAYGCTPAALRDTSCIKALLDQVIVEVGLHVAAPPLFHAFTGAGGLTALYMLQESHLTCHTYPEHGFAGFNLYCCRPRPPWPWQKALQQTIGAARVSVRCLTRGGES